MSSPPQKKYGTRAVGVDIDPQHIKENNENARVVGVTNHLKFPQHDLFEIDFSEATMATLYLLSVLNLKLRPNLLCDLKFLATSSPVMIDAAHIIAPQSSHQFIGDEEYAESGIP